MTTENQNKATALILTIFFHTILLVFLFLFILKTPLPPFGGGQGVVLNLGFVDEGTGEVQTFNQPNDSPVQVENKPSEQEVVEPDQVKQEEPKSSFNRNQG